MKINANSSYALGTRVPLVKKTKSPPSEFYVPVHCSRATAVTTTIIGLPGGLGADDANN